MLEMTNGELVQFVVDMTMDYTDAFFEAHGKHEKMDRQQWAALHLGFIAAMKLNGYDEKDMVEIVQKAQDKLPPAHSH